MGSSSSRPDHLQRRPPGKPRRAIARAAPSRGTSSAGVPTTRTTSAPTNQPTDRPSSDRAGTTALTTRWIGTNASSRAHHQRRHRAGSHGPDTVSTAASIPIQRGSSRNCESTVSRRSVKIEMPLRGRDAVAGDRQQQDRGDTPRRRRRSAASTAARRSARSGSRTAARGSRRRRSETVSDWVGSARRRSRRSTLRVLPIVARDQRAGDDDDEEDPQEREPQNVIGAPGQWLEQAPRDDDVPPVNAHGSTIIAADRSLDGDVDGLIAGRPEVVTLRGGERHALADVGAVRDGHDRGFLQRCARQPPDDDTVALVLECRDGGVGVTAAGRRGDGRSGQGQRCGDEPGGDAREDEVLVM